MSVLVYLSDTAKQHFLEIDGYWREHNPSISNLFQDELDEALMRLSEFPQSGRAHQDRPGVRQTLLRKTSCYVYYRQNEKNGAIRVLAIWSTKRGTTPL